MEGEEPPQLESTARLLKARTVTSRVSTNDRLNVVNTARRRMITGVRLKNARRPREATETRAALAAVFACCVETVTVTLLLIPGARTTDAGENVHDAYCGRFAQLNVTVPLKPADPVSERL